MFEKICTGLLAFCLLLITLQNAPYLAHGYMLHIAPMLVLCWLTWAILRQPGPPATSTVFWTLAACCVVGVAMELGFGMYKRKPFDENGVATITSFAQLLASSFTAFAIWCKRRKPGRFHLTDMATIWLLIAIGFLYLATDEEILLHEGIGRDIKRLLHLATNAWSVRLDDMLIGVYGLIGLGALWAYRAELKLFRACDVLLAVGFFWLAVSVAADMASHRPDFFVWLLGPERGMVAYDLGEDADEIAKLIAEVFFLSGFSSALGQTRRRNVKRPA